MKVGILTFHWADNYGAVLQAYALSQRMKELCNKEDDVEIVNYLCPTCSKIYRPFYYRKNGFASNTKSLLRCIKNFPDWIKKRSGFQSFRKRMPISKAYSRESLFASESDYDIWITGSDQVWNTGIVENDYDVFDLSFVHSRKKCSYAASSGPINASKDDRQLQLVRDIEKLDHISVRELSTKKELASLISKDIVHVVDPTFLLSKETWNALIAEKRVYQNKYVFVYYIVYDSELMHIAIKVAKALSVDIVVCGKGRAFQGIAKQIADVSPEEFLNLIKNAEFVVASSFHATAFSTIFEKQFLALAPSYASNRVNDLCQLFGLASRVVHDAASVDRLLGKQIDYETVNIRVKEEIAKSEDFLRGLLK